MTIESVILTWCNETENIFSDSRVAITCFHASSMGNSCNWLILEESVCLVSFM